MYEMEGEDCDPPCVQFWWWGAPRNPRARMLATANGEKTSLRSGFVIENSSKNVSVQVV